MGGCQVPPDPTFQTVRCRVCTQHPTLFWSGTGTGRVEAYHPLNYPWCALFHFSGWETRKFGACMNRCPGCWCNFLWKCLKESTEIRIIVVIRHWMLVDDLSFRLVWCECARFFWLLLAFAPNFHTHPTPEQKVGCQVSGGHPSSWNLGFWISSVHPNFAEKVRYRVSGVPRPRVQGPACWSQDKHYISLHKHNLCYLSTYLSTVQ
jgi:hypothetical protein